MVNCITGKKEGHCQHLSYSLNRSLVLTMQATIKGNVENSPAPITMIAMIPRSDSGAHDNLTPGMRDRAYIITASQLMSYLPIKVEAHNLLFF